MILCTEVKPKIACYKTTEAVAGYELHTAELSSKDSTWGTCVYTLNMQQARKPQMTTEIKESTWIKIRLETNDDFLACCIYSSLQSDNLNNERLRNLMQEVSKRSSTYALIVGDFNYPNVDWNTQKTEGDSTDGEDYKIVESFRDGYWFQHVTKNWN